MRITKTLFTVSMLALLVPQTYACTTALLTKGASADGSMSVTHSNDGYTGDTSVVYVPAADHEEGEVRYVYPSACARILHSTTYHCSSQGGRRFFLDVVR